MKKFHCLVATGTMGLASLGLPVFAQTGNAEATPPGKDSAQPPSLETVVVTGVRASLENAVNKKRNADQIVDAVSAEDIGKFPVQNLAESLQHITGVQISRSYGEGSKVSIRGLDPQFNRVLYNGRELTSPTGDRSFSFSNLSATLIAGLEAYKMPTADQSEGGLAGIINVVTPSPLQIGKQTLVANLSSVYSQNKGEAKPHLALLFNTVNEAKTFGLTLGLDHDEKPIHTDRYQAFGVLNTPINTFGPVLRPDAGNAAPDSVAGLNAAHTYGFNVGKVSRQNYLLTAQARPSKDLEAKFDLLYSKSKEEVDAYINCFRPVNIAGPGAGINAFHVQDGVLNYLEVIGVDHRNVMREYNYDDSILSPAFSVLYRSGDWKVSGEVSGSRAKRITNTMALDTIARAHGIMDMGEPSNWAEPLKMSFGPGYDDLDPKKFRLIGINGDYNRPNSGSNVSAKVDLSYGTGLSYLPTVSFGAKLTKAKETMGSNSLQADGKQLAALLGVPFDATLEGGSADGSPYMRLLTQSRFADAPAQFIASHYKNLPISLADIAAAVPPTQNLASVYTVREDSKAVYGKLDFELMEGKLTGNVGLRVVRTDQVSEGFSPDLSQIKFTQQGAVTIIPVVTPASVSRSYTNALPSVNARYELSADHVLRLGVAQVMSRPNLMVLAPNTTVNANVLSISAGNPNVKPFLSKQFDLSYEWYLGKGGLLSVSGFYKDVKNFIVSTSKNVDLNVEIVQGGSKVQTFSYHTPDNGASSQIKGLELGYQQPLTFLPGPLRDTGVVLSYTYVDAGKTRVVEGGPELALPGVSKQNYNLKAYYDNGTFDASISYSFRDKFVNDNASYFGDGELTKSYAQLDLAASYKFDDRFSLYGNVLNVTDSALSQVTYNNVNRGKDYAGRRFTLGVNMKF